MNKRVAFIIKHFTERGTELSTYNYAKYNESIFIYQPNGESFQYSKNRNLFQSQNEKIEIYSGTIIYVPRKVNNEYITRLRTQAYASILSGLAVSLASVSVLGSN